MKTILNCIKRTLARIPSHATVATIMANTHCDEAGNLYTPDGRRIGKLDYSTGIGSCSLLGYIHLCLYLKKMEKTQAA